MLVNVTSSSYLPCWLPEFKNVTEEVAPQSQNPMVVGNKTEKLADVDLEILEQLKEGKRGQLQLFTPTESRGIEEEVLAAADTSIVEMYLAFQKAIEDKNFLCGQTETSTPAGKCADSYYAVLSREPQLEKLHSTMRRNYAAALQDDAQQVLNNIMKSDLQELFLSKISKTTKYEHYPLYLGKAAELLGKNHYMYSVLIARKLYFEGYLLSLQTANPDEELGNAALKKFRSALLLQPDMPLTYLLMSDVFGTLILQPDSMEHFAQLAADQAPSWTYPYTSTAFRLIKKYKKYDRAAYYLEKARQVDSSSVLVEITWGNMYMNTRDS